MNSKFTTDDGVHVFCLIEDILFPCLPNWSLVVSLAQDGHLPGYNCTYRSFRDEQKQLPVHCRLSKGPHVPPRITISVTRRPILHESDSMTHLSHCLTADVETNLRIQQISTNVLGCGL